MPVYPGDPPVSLSPAATIASEGYNVLRVSMGSQSGTHVDAPFHFIDEGARIDAMGLSHFLAPARIVELVEVGARAPISWTRLGPAVENLRAGHMVLLHTGWSRWWGTGRYLDHPYLTADAARGLVAAGVRTVGLDALSVDETARPGDDPSSFAAHEVLLEAGCAVVENLTNLAAVDWPDPLVSVLPVKLADADGAPVRAVAFEVVGQE